MPFEPGRFPIRVLASLAAPLIGVLLLATAAAAAEDAPPPAPTQSGCSAWHLEGYRVGMSKEEASGVRPAETHRDASVLKVKEKGSFTGKLWFSHEALFYWEADYDDQTARDLIAAISARLGSPTFDAFDEIEHGRNDFLITKGEKEDPPDREAGWESRECDTAIYVKQEFFTAGGRLVVQAFLVQLSRLEEAVGGPVRMIPSWMGDD